MEGKKRHRVGRVRGFEGLGETGRNTDGTGERDSKPVSALRPLSNHTSEHPDGSSQMPPVG